METLSCETNPSGEQAIGLPIEVNGRQTFGSNVYPDNFNKEESTNSLVSKTETKNIFSFNDIEEINITNDSENKQMGDDGVIDIDNEVPTEAKIISEENNFDNESTKIIEIMSNIFDGQCLETGNHVLVKEEENNVRKKN